jgi:2,3-bisphosphoglycerate-dependent phosphoglycerate mutase
MADGAGGGDHIVEIVRHGSTHLNSDDSSVDRIRGWNDIPLNDAGRLEARQIAEKMAKSPPQVLATSDLIRAVETAQIISRRIGVPISLRSRAFRPWNVGELTGKVTDDALPTLKKYIDKTPDAKLPGGGESFNDFAGRFFAGIRSLLEQHDGKRVAVVSHHRNERLMTAWKADGYDPALDVDKAIFAERGSRTGGVTAFRIPADSLEETTDMTDTSMAAGAGDDGSDNAGDGGDQGSTLCCSIYVNSDGTFTMVPGGGDEDQEAGASAGAAGQAGAAADAGAGPGGAGSPGAEGQEASSPSDQGEHFDNIADLMKAVLEEVQEAAKGGGEEQGMDEGFNQASDQSQPGPSPVGPNS